MAKKNTPELPSLPPQAGAEGTRTKAERRAAAQALVREQQRQARRRTVLIQVGVGAVVVAAVIAITLAVLGRQGSSDAGAPPGLTADGTIRFGADDAAVTVLAVEDFQCPACKAFEAASGELMKSYRDGEDVAVEYKPIAFLDRASTTEYSSRAANAAACVLADSGKDTWMTFHDALYANQPEEGGEGLPDSELIDLADQAGASGDDVASCIEDRRYDGWVEQQTDATMGKNGVTSTPSVFVNDALVEVPDPDSLGAAVAAASGS